MQSIHSILQICIGLNAILLIFLFFMIINFKETVDNSTNTTNTTNNINNQDSFMNIGPNPSLIILGVKISNWYRYLLLQLIILCFQVTDTIINQFASPILGFNIYNPDKKVITEFTKFQLQFYCQSMWFINSLKGALMLLVSISQIDIAISKVIYNELAAIYTIRTLINKKIFKKPEDIINDNESEPFINTET